MEKIKQLIAEGTITHSDVMEYLRDYHESIDWEADQMEDNPEEHYLDWSDDSNDQDDCIVQDLFPKEETHPDDKGLDTEYVLLSTAYRMKETYVFPSNKEGQHLSWSEMVGLAERYSRYDNFNNENDWLDTDKVLAKLIECSGHTYEFVEKLHEDKDHKVLLYKRTDL